MNTKERSFSPIVAWVSMLVVLMGTAGCHRMAAKLVAGNPSGSLNTPTTLTTVLPILNEGTVRAENVQANSISISGGTLTTPATLPAPLGTVPTDGLVNLASVFFRELPSGQ